MNCLIFDFDGLILDTERTVFEIWKNVFRDRGAELRLEDWIQCVGTFGGPFYAYDHLERLTGSIGDRETLRSSITHKKRLAADALPLMAGVKDRIEEAVSLGWRVALASSSQAEWVKPQLQRLGILDRFDCVQTRDDVKRVKPNPELFLNVSALLRVNPACCLVLEDSLNGVIAAKAAGMSVVAVPNSVTGFLNFEAADARVSSLADWSLAEFLRN